MDKNRLREKYKAKRKELSDSQREKFLDLLLIQFQSMHLEIPRMIASYKAAERLGEIDLQAIERYCHFKNPAVGFCYPVVDLEQASMHFIHTTEDDAFVENSYGIAQPVTGTMIDARYVKLMFIPLLAFDKEGNRVGYGKGFYDKYLAESEDHVLKVGFSYFEAEEELITDKTYQDIPLDYCITPYRIYEFS